MGSLKPGATYIYERADGIIYAREMGADPQDRFVVGYESGKDYDPLTITPDGRPMRDHWAQHHVWPNIHRAARTNPALQEALDRVKVIYELSKQNDQD
jgi:hypothetical protein